MFPLSLPVLIVLAVPMATAVALAITVWRIRHAQSRIRAALRAERRAGEHFRMAAEHANDGLVVQTMDSTIVWANPAYLRIMGRTEDEVLGKSPFDFAFPPDQRPVASQIRGFRYNPNAPDSERLQLFRNRRGDGTLFWNQINVGFRSSQSGETHAILVCRDVSESVAQAESLRAIRDRLAHEASHDGLTGLANRAELLRFAREALESAARNQRPVGIFHLDLDRFKDINDTHGHSAGDHTLKHAAAALRKAVRRSDLVARIGGDEFVVVCPGLPDFYALDKLARELAAGVARPFPFDELTLTVRASIGCVLSDPGQTDPEELLLRSDFALYEAKRAGRGRVAVYDEGLHQRHLRAQNRAADLREVIEIDRLDHMFQPVVDLASGRIAGFETLVRWQHDTEGIISPADFLPLAEELGLLAQLDLASMEAALAFKRRLTVAGHGAVTLSFNASSDLLRHPSFINRLVFGAEAAGMDRSQIAIEVLETTVFTDRGDQGSPAHVIRDLRDAGFHVYLDDFGMGYAGLAHLAELAITGIKLDQLLVRRLLTNETSAKIVATIIELCRDLNLRMIAEGVEDQATAARLHQMGCPMIQGYWLSRPMPAEAALDYVLDHKGAIPPPRLRRQRSNVA